MKRIVWIFFLFLIGVVELRSQDLHLSDSTVVSLITCSPGKEIYAIFGHSAIRVNDPQQRYDIVFNYGIFDFNTNNFYFKFIKGETDYQVMAYDFSYFMPEYIIRNSTVWEQELDLTPEEKRDLIANLFMNCRPENKVYRYNFVYDNCATRPRDKVYEVLDGEIQSTSADGQITFRQWIERYAEKDSWVMFWIDMIFGADSDKLATAQQSMFLPEVLMSEFDGIRIVDKNSGTARPLVVRTNILSEQKPEEIKETPFVFKPIMISFFILIVISLFAFYGERKWLLNRIIKTIVYSVAGLIGSVIFFLMFFSEHPLVGTNYNLLWLNPLFLLSAIGLWTHVGRKLFFYLMVILFFSLLLSFLAFMFALQYFNPAFIPLMLTLFVLTAGNLWEILSKKHIQR